MIAPFSLPSLSIPYQQHTNGDLAGMSCRISMGPFPAAHSSQSKCRTRDRNL